MSTDTRAAARAFALHELEKPGRTRAQVARDAEVDPKTLRTFLDGTHWPQSDKRSRISVALGWAPDEIDHIERTGEHRASVTYRNTETGETWEQPFTTTRVSVELTKLFAEATFFYVFVAEHFPGLEERANELVQSSADLMGEAMNMHREGRARFGRDRLSDMADTTVSLIAANDEKWSISGEQEQPETP